MMKRTAIASLALLCASCTSLLVQDLESRQHYVDTHQLSDPVREAILEGRVISGMTMDDVYATWGLPSERDTSETLGLHGKYGKQVWIYLSIWDDSTEAEVFFRNGVVYSVSPEYLSSIPRD